MSGVRTRIKVCGITSPHDAELAASLGADAVGLIFAESPRRIDVRRAQEIVRALPPFVTAVGVFVDAPAAGVAKVAEDVGLGAVQLHGSESPEIVAEVALRVKVIKAFRVQGPETLAACKAYGAASAFLFDTYAKDKLGGTGITFDWSLLTVAGVLPSKPWILAGGLNPDNVADAIARCRPYAVDVSSGVERQPGVKDPQKLQEFITKARQVWP